MLHKAVAKAPDKAEGEDKAEGAERRSLFRGKRGFWLPVIPLLVADLLSKHYVFQFLAERSGDLPHYDRRYLVWDGPISFHLVQWYNTGTIWGLAQDHPWALRSLRCVAVAVILWFVWRTARCARLQLIALGVILPGALCNLFDNFTVVVPHKPSWNGGVRDFLHFTFWGWDFPAFNVADSCISCGAFALAIWLLFHDPGPRKPSRTTGEIDTAG